MSRRCRGACLGQPWRGGLDCGIAKTENSRLGSLFIWGFTSNTALHAGSPCLLSVGLEPVGRQRIEPGFV